MYYKVNNEKYHTIGGDNTQDQVFLLSIEEARKYFPSDKDRVCKPTDYALWKEKRVVDNEFGCGCWWWLRSPGDDSESAAYVYPSGVIHDNGDGVYDCTVAVRPALWVNIDS